MHGIIDHENTYLSQVIYMTGYMHTTFLPDVCSMSCRFSLQETTPELDIGFLHQGRKRQLYLMTTYIMGFYAKPESIGFTSIKTCYIAYFHTLVDFHSKLASTRFIGILNATPMCC